MVVVLVACGDSTAIFNCQNTLSSSITTIPTVQNETTTTTTSTHSASATSTTPSSTSTSTSRRTVIIVFESFQSGGSSPQRRRHRVLTAERERGVEGGVYLLRGRLRGGGP